MVNEIYKKLAKKYNFENAVQIAVPCGMFDEKNIQSTDILDLIDETEKAVKVQDINWNEAWFPKSQIEMRRIV